MEDREIIALFHRRDERAIRESDRKYGSRLRGMARCMLHSGDDAEECVNDTWMRGWRRMPPDRPRSLEAYFMRITRNLCLDRLRRLRAAKRGAGEYSLALNEIQEVTSNRELTTDSDAIRDCIESFLSQQSPRKRWIFMRRYWYLNSARQIAIALGGSESNVRSTLTRMRAELKRMLEEEGISL